MMLAIVLHLTEIDPSEVDLNAKYVLLIANTTEKFELMDYYQKMYPEMRFYYLNHTKHVDEAKNLNLVQNSVLLMTIFGIEDIHNLTALPIFFKYSNITPDFTETTFLVSDEEDMVLASEFLDKQVIAFYAQQNCKDCHHTLLQTMQIAYFLKKKVLYADCTGSRSLQLMCSRHEVRAFPWIALLQDDKLHPLGKEPTIDNLAGWVEEITTGNLSSRGIFFERSWFEEHKTKFDADGYPSEFPIKPDVLSLESKMLALEKGLAKLSRLA